VAENLVGDGINTNSKGGNVDALSLTIADAMRSGFGSFDEKGFHKLLQ